MLWDPQSGVIGLLMTQRLWEAPVPPPSNVDFSRATYDAVSA